MPPALLLRKNPRTCWKLPFSSSELDGIVRAMLHAAGQDNAGVELTVLDDASMAALHKETLGCQGPTNILSFAAGEERPGIPAEDAPRQGDSGLFLGWLALSADTLSRECFLYGQAPEEHCVRLLAHGLAHLLGHDHGPAMESLCFELESAALDSPAAPGSAPLPS